MICEFCRQEIKEFNERLAVVDTWDYEGLWVHHRCFLEANEETPDRFTIVETKEVF